MAIKLLDTTFLIHYWAGNDAVAAYLEDHEETAEFITSTINIKELAVGRELQGRSDRHELLETFDWIHIVPFEVDHAFIAGRLEADLRANAGINRDKINSLGGDLLIGAIASDLDAPVVTRNVDDFDLFEGVTVETY